MRSEAQSKPGWPRWASLLRARTDVGSIARALFFVFTSFQPLVQPAELAHKMRGVPYEPRSPVVQVCATIPCGSAAPDGSATPHRRVSAREDRTALALEAVDLGNRTTLE